MERCFSAQELTRRHFHFVLLVQLVIWLSISFYAHAGELDASAIPDYLDTFADAIQQNYEKIQTWQGSYEFSDSNRHSVDQTRRFLEFNGVDVQDPGEMTQRMNGSASFAVDTLTGQVFCDLLPSGTPAMEWADTGKAIQGLTPEPFHRVSVINGDAYLYFDPEQYYGTPRNWNNNDGGPARSAFRTDRSEGKEQLLSNIINPAIILSGGTNNPIWDQLRDVAALIRKDGVEFVEGHPSKLAVKENGAGQRQYHLILNMNGNDATSFLTSDLMFDEAVGLNIVEQRTTLPAGRVITKSTTKYAQVDGKFVPSEFMHATMSPDGKNVQFSRVMKLKQSELNVELSPEQFTFKALGLKEGDQLRDLLDNVEYTYRNGELVRNEGKALMERENLSERLDELPAAVPSVKEKAENKPPMPMSNVEEDGREASFISRLPVLLAVLMLIILTWGFVGRLFLRR